MKIKIIKETFLSDFEDRVNAILREFEVENDEIRDIKFIIHSEKNRSDSGENTYYNAFILYD